MIKLTLTVIFLVANAVREWSAAALDRMDGVKR